MFENKKIFILGMARSGYEVAKMLSQYNNEILITDMQEQNKEQVTELTALGVNYVITDTPEELLDENYDFVIKNPGVRKDHKCILKANQMNIKVINEVECAYHFLPQNIKIIAITGSNGKTTVTTMIYEILKKQNFHVHLGGNIGFPLSSLIGKVKENDLLVLEISDHQLVDMYDFKPHISVFTNISEAHLDFHGTYEIYKDTKKKLFVKQTKNDIAILNLENNDVIALTKDIEAKKIYFSSKQVADICIKDNYIYYQNEAIINLSKIKLQGVHNYENIMCALAPVKLLNCDNNTIQSFLEGFSGVEHRLEYIKTIKGIKFYNDSKSTNTEATIIALKSFQDPTILILGGLDRNHLFEPLNNYLNNTKLIIAYGETKKRIKKWANAINHKCLIADNLEEATKLAYENAKSQDIVLLSPACASWDQYKCFEDRGNEFKEIVNSL